MPQQTLALEPNGEPRLHLQWGGYMRDFRITLDGEEIGQIDGGQRELKQGRDFTLPDGSTLTIRLEQSMMMDELQVFRDGQPLEGSAAHPSQKLLAAVKTSFQWGVGLLIAGCIAAFMRVNLATSLLFTPLSIGFGLALMACSAWMFRRSPVAVVVGAAVFVADAIFGFRALTEAGIQFGFLSTLSVLLRFMALVVIVQGLRGFRHRADESAG